eukprot:341968-Rhodomonas_salina.1
MVGFTHVEDIPEDDAWEKEKERDDDRPSSAVSEADTTGQDYTAHQLRGTQIAREDIKWLEKIGNGAMCEVFKVEFNGKIAAGKKLFDKFSDDSMSKPFQVLSPLQSSHHRSRYSHESMADLGSHPNVCEFYGFSLGPNDSPVLVMELIEVSFDVFSVRRPVLT